MTISMNGSSWRTTVKGILTVLTTGGLILLSSGSPLIGTKTTQYITLGLALANGYIQLISKDAETVTSNDVSKANVAAATKGTK